MEINKIIIGCQKQDAHFQRLLFDRFSGRMMTLCLRYCNFQKQDAEDVLQEGFVRIFMKINLYKDFGSFEGWMKRVFINIALRKKEKKDKRLLISMHSEHTTDIAKLPSIIDKLDAQEILNLIELLPKGYQLIFNMYAIDGYSHKEIAELLDIQPATSRSQLTKAKQMLRKAIFELQQPQNKVL